MAKKKKITKPNKHVIEIDGGEDDTLSLPVKINGKDVGTIEDEIIPLHRLALTCQGETEQDEDWIPKFQTRLRKKYDVPVDYVATYRIANVIFAAFDYTKKDGGG